MSDINIEVVEIKAINPHPGADRLEIATILGTTCCVTKGQYKVGQLVVWFPPNILIPETLAVQIGVKNYLKTAEFPGDKGVSQCRVAACRLRGVPSFGFIIDLDTAHSIIVPNKTVGFAFSADQMLTGYFNAYKYEPPVKLNNGNAASDHDAFHRYTDIQNYYRYSAAIPDGTPVRITEKLHGSNIRLGRVDGQYMVGSNRVNWKPGPNKWWDLMTPDVMRLLESFEGRNVIVFGEMFGPGIQDMDYGAKEPTLRVFDISLDGRYLSWTEVLLKCMEFGIKTVPLLYSGPFHKDVLQALTDGPTTMGVPKAKFKGREGCVVTPLNEQHSDTIGGRMILKSVSADYLDRKDAQDN